MTDEPLDLERGRSQAKVVVLTALRVEYDAVTSHLEGNKGLKRLSGGTFYEIGKFSGTQIDWVVAVAEIGAGNEGAAIEATRAIDELKPALLMFVGVAGSLKPQDAPLGSVVVAESVYGYQAGKDSKDFAPRAVSLRTSHFLTQRVRQVTHDVWSGDHETPVCLGPVAAGNVVVGSSKSRTYELIRRYFSDAVAVEMESLGLYLAADRARRLPVLSVRGISDSLDDKTAQADIERQPVAAANAAAFAFEVLQAMGPEDIDVLSSGNELTAAPEASEWASVPFSTADLLQRATESHRDEALKLLAILAKGKSDPQVTVDALLSGPPKWLSDAGSGLLWAAIGEYALSYGLHSSASAAFDQAAAKTGGDSALYHALCAVSLACECGSVKALEKLKGGTLESEELPTPLARAVITENTADILNLTSHEDGTHLRPSVYRLRALQLFGRISEAIALGDRILDLHPSAAGSALIVAQLLIQGATDGSSPLGYDASITRARELALGARDLRRSWGGDSTEAAILAGRASMLLRDGATALQITSLPPDGSALPWEASQDDIRDIRVNALLLLRRKEDALTEAAGFSDGVMKKLAEADCLVTLGREDRARELYIAAVDKLLNASPDDPGMGDALFHADLGLSELGVYPIPGIDRLRALNADAARKVEIVSDIARGDSKGAIQSARKSGRPNDVDLLVEALIRANQADDALSVLKEAAQRLSRAEHLLHAVNILAREGRFKDAYEEAVGALAVVADGTHLKTQLRRAAVETAAMIPDWNATRAQARAAMAAGDATEDMRWALVIALNNTLDIEDALAEAVRDPELKPRTEQEARLLMSLHAVCGKDLPSVLAVLDIAEACPGSEEIGAAAFGAIVSLSKDLELPEDVRERLARASDTFFDRFPDSTYLRRIEPRPEKIAEVLEASGDPWAVPAVRETAERISVGALPLPLLADIASKPYVEVLVKRGMGWTVGKSADVAVQEREQAAALESIGRPVVVEMSAAYGMILTELPSEALSDLFPQTMVAQVQVEDAIRGARNLALRSTASMRWDATRESAVLDESSPEEADRWALESEQIERTLRASASKTPSKREDEMQKLPLILQPVQLAKELGIALYSDDVALRLLAASEGVPAFGTADLLAAAEKHQLLPKEVVAGATDALRRNRYADMDWSLEDLMRIAEQEEFRPAGGACGTLARPVFWSNPLVATPAYRSLLAEMTERNLSPDVLGAWHAAATTGLLQASRPAVRSQIAGGLLALALLSLALRPDALPALLDGTRQGTRALDVEDPLPSFCRGLAHELAKVFGEAEGGRMYVVMMQQLEPADRAVALRELLAAGQREKSGTKLEDRA